MSETKTIKFYGHSDDTFGWSEIVNGEERGGDDHDDCANGTVRVYEVKADGLSFAVTGVYGKGCMWSVGIAPMEDDDPIPPWPMTWAFEGHTATLTLKLPKKATVTLIYPTKDNDD